MLNALGVSARIRMCACLLASPLALPGAADTASATLEAAATRGQQLMREGRYDQAGVVMRDALKASRDAQPDDPWLGLLLNNLGVYYQDLRNCDQSRAAFRRSLAIFERQRHPSQFTTAANLGSLLLECSHSREAARLWEKTLEPGLREIPDGDPRLARVLVFRANLLAAQKRYPDAEPVAARALAISERNLGPDHVNNVLTLNSLSIIQWRLHRYDDATRNLRRAADLLEAASLAGHPMLAKAYVSLSQICADAGRYEEAELYSRKALEIAVANFGRDSSFTADILFARAGVLQRTNRKEEADAARREARTALANAFRAGAGTVDVTELAR